MTDTTDHSTSEPTGAEASEVISESGASAAREDGFQRVQFSGVATGDGAPQTQSAAVEALVAHPENAQTDEVHSDALSGGDITAPAVVAVKAPAKKAPRSAPPRDAAPGRPVSGAAPRPARTRPAKKSTAKQSTAKQSTAEKRTAQKRTAEKSTPEKATTRTIPVKKMAKAANVASVKSTGSARKATKATVRTQPRPVPAREPVTAAAPAAGAAALSGLVEALAGAYTQLNEEIAELTELNTAIAAMCEELDARTGEFRDRLRQLTEAQKQIPDRELRDLLGAALAPLKQRPGTGGTDQRAVSVPAMQRPAPPAARTRPGRRKAAVPVSSAVVRAWAQQNGVPVSARGRVSTEAVTAYQQAHS